MFLPLTYLIESLILNQNLQIIMERNKKCRYCQSEFKAKRIDAMYCSDSCRQMSFRRQSDPHTYGKVVPIYFELDDHEYSEVLKNASAQGVHPNDYVKQLIVNEDRSIMISLDEIEKSNLNTVGLYYHKVPIEKLVHNWMIERIKNEMDKLVLEYDRS